MDVVSTAHEAHDSAEQDQNVSHIAVRTPPRRPTSEQVREQLENLIASHRFTSSPRCQALLRHVVESALNGNAESLKERNIGVDLFNRNPAYDTNADPAVRVAASEIRKKLAQYYYEPGNQDQVRIELPIGSYAPFFSLPDSAPPKESPPHHTEAALPTQEAIYLGPLLPEQSAQSAAPRRGKLILAAVAICVLALSAAIPIWHAAVAKSPVEIFWAPVLNSPNPVLICSGQLRATRVELAPVTSRNPSGWVMPLGPNGIYPKNLSVVVLEDAITMANIGALLRAEKKQFSIQGESITSYEHLQNGPAVLLGAFNNDWTVYLTRSMRYRFMQNTDGYQWIEDEKNPSAKIGLQRPDKDTFGPTEYGIIARVVDPETKQPAIIIAGVTPAGTFAGGRFATDPQLLKDFLKTAPANWQNKNFEMLFSVNVIDNQPGAPRIVASSIW